MKLVLVLICLWGLGQGLSPDELFKMVSNADPYDKDPSTVSGADMFFNEDPTPSLVKTKLAFIEHYLATCIRKFDTNGDSVWNMEEWLAFMMWVGKPANGGKIYDQMGCTEE